MSTQTPTEITFNTLPPHTQRQFVDQDIDLTQVDNVTLFYQKLLGREVNSLQELEQWVLDRSELETALHQVGSILYIRMTCDTSDPSRAQAYQQFIETVSPAVKPLDDQLNKKYLEMLEQFPLDSSRYEVYNRELKEDIQLFRQENVDLQTKVELLSQEYQTITGAMTVEFEGEEKTLPQMGKYLYDPNRELREKAWKATATRRLQDKEKLEEIFDKMMTLRNQVATNAGCANFREYKFRSLHRFDYTPEDCKQYHQTMEECVVPLWKEILQKRCEEMSLDKLRPWDTAVDPLGRSPLKPFEDVSKLIDGCEAMFQKVDPQLGSQFTEMKNLNLLDLASRKGKAPGGYQSALDEARKPFIFMNAVGLDDDIRTLLHEGGHAFHSFACANDPLVDYRHGPMEFNEVASMAMELLAGEYLSEFYNKEDETRSRIDHLEGIVHVLIWVAIVDAFQHLLYENPTHSQSERKQTWLDLNNRFSTGLVNWEGLEEEFAYSWHRQLHIFEVPFYYIEYGIAQLGALQVWRNAKADWSKALSDYRSGLALGGSRPLPEIYTTAGIRFDFSKETIAPLMDLVQKELSILNKK